jgi:F-type H+-transporting ATPase subunit b
MEKLGQFGIDPLLLAAQIINFIILLLIFKRFLYKPILAILKKRELKIKEGLLAAEKGEAFLAKAKEEENEILSKANTEARGMVEEASVRAGKLEEETVEKARLEAADILESTKAQILQEEALAEKRLQGKTLDTAVAVLEQILPKVLTKEDHIKILQNTQKALQRQLA